MRKTVSFISLAFLAVSSFAADALHSAPIPSDAEIAQILLTANAGEVDAGKLAKKKTENADVKEFAEMMINEHSSVSDQTRSLAKKIDLKPAKSVASKDAEKDHEKAEKRLKSLKGAEFDREYVDAMVAGHQAVLDTLDSTLIPNAKNAELKDFLTKVRPAVESHLQHAKSLQAKLASGKSSG